MLPRSGYMYRFTQEISVSSIMTALHKRTLWSTVTVCQFAYAGAIVLDPHNLISPESMPQNCNQTTIRVDSDTHCTHDPTWLAPSSQTSSGDDYQDTCGSNTADAASNLIQSIRVETGHHQDTTFELLDRGTIPQTSMPKICLPQN